MRKCFKIYSQIPYFWKILVKKQLHGNDGAFIQHVLITTTAIKRIND